MRFPYSWEEELVWCERLIPRLEAERDAKKKKGDPTWTGSEADLKHAVIKATYLRHKLNLPSDRIAVTLKPMG